MKWSLVLDHVDVAMLVMDRERTLRFVNGRARQLLGFDPGESLGKRCLLTTRGLDCGDACPLTFALERGLEVVEDFAAVYQTREGRPVPLRVTVVPLRDEDGKLTGHVEILRPTEPDPGFYLAGESEHARRLRSRVAELATSRVDLEIVGEVVAAADVARTLHRFAGLDEGLFHLWSSPEQAVPLWPPGTVYVPSWGDEVEAALQGLPDGWWLIVGARPGSVRDGREVLELPALDQRREDLPAMIATWAGHLRPGVRVRPEALQRLVRMATELGLDCVHEVLRTAVAAAGDRLECAHLPNDCYSTALVDELLRSERPLAALEERLLREVLERSGWRMQEAADRLGISRVTLWRKLKDHGIERG